MSTLSAAVLIKEIALGIVDLFYPTKCVVCDILGPDIICPSCKANLYKLVPEPYCLRCGQYLIGDECLKCVDYPISLVRCRAMGVLDGNLAELIHKLKYREQPMLAAPLGALLADYLIVRAEIMNELRFDGIVPVPLHKSRERTRGYNQSELLAKELSRRLNVPTLSRSVKRVRNTKQQVGKVRSERLNNLKGAFEADPMLCVGKTFLLVDDVSTTGATISQCAEAMINAGAAKVYAITLASG